MHRSGPAGTQHHTCLYISLAVKNGKDWERHTGKWKDLLYFYFCNRLASHALLTAACTSTCCSLTAQEGKWDTTVPAGRQLQWLCQAAPAEAVLQQLCSGCSEVPSFSALISSLACLMSAVHVICLRMEPGPFCLSLSLLLKWDLNQLGV